MKKTKFGDLFREWELSGVKLNMKFAELEFNPTDDDQTAAWDMYVELITRITTQSLSEDDGDEASALESVYKLFDITREILKSEGRKATQFTKIAIIVLNQVVRPFTSKWHKKMLNKAFENEEECKEFRTELSKIQVELRKYTKLLASMADVEDLTDIEKEG